MFGRRTPYRFKIAVWLTLLPMVVPAAACNKSEQPAPSDKSTASSPVNKIMNAVQGGGEFEGIIGMRMDAENQKGVEMTYFIKGQHSRIETNLAQIPEGQSVMLWDLEGGKMTTLMPSKKVYMTMDLKETAEGVREAARKMKGSKDEEKEDTKFPKLTSTGKQETIAGYSCEHWLMGEKQDMDICVAKGLGYFGMGGQARGGFGSLKNLSFDPKLLATAAAHPEWVKFLEGGAFPLKLTMLENGKVKMKMEATRIERKTLDDSLFSIPPGYKELNMQNLMRGKQ